MLPFSKGSKPSSLGREDNDRIPRLDALLTKHELVVVFLLCAVAAVRIFLFSAAFPPFNNVDEQAHFDTVYKYAEERPPAGLEHFSRHPSEIFTVYGSPEYLHKPHEMPGGEVPPPLWTLSSKDPELVRYRQVATEVWQNSWNTEDFHPPAYYVLAAGWYKLGKLFGARGGFELYWLRFLNIPIYVLLMWCAYVFVRRDYPGSLLLRIGVPLILAFLPQDVFYSVSNDVLSSVTLCVSFYCLVEVCKGNVKSYLMYALIGLTSGVAVLVKTTNLSVVALVGVSVILAAIRQRRVGMLREGLPKLAVLLITCLLPIGLWMTRNYRALGDITGGAQTLQYLGWSPKPFSELLHHPIFSPSGAFYFIHELILSFWRGEIVWHGSQMAYPGVDAFFFVTTLVFVLIAAVGIWLRRSKDAQDEQFVDRMSLLALVVSVMPLIAVSIMYDFGHCWSPSRARPFLMAGRLLTGILVPFLVLYLKGLYYLTARIKPPIGRYLALLVVVGMMIVPEILLTIPAFSSRFNWFHML